MSRRRRNRRKQRDKAGVLAGDKTDVRLMRPKSTMSQTDAWASISKSTGLKKSQVKAAHTAKAWRWVLKK